MRKAGWAALVVVVVAAVIGTVLYGQEPGRGGPGAGQGPGPGAAAMDPERMKTQLLLLGLNTQEQNAAIKGMTAKQKARQALQEQLNTLRLAADGPLATDKELTQAIATYLKALAQYHKVVQTEDAATVKRLSAKSHARCLAAGVLDNGLGGGGRTRTGGGRGGGRGGGGGGGGRGAGGGFGGGGPE